MPSAKVGSAAAARHYATKRVPPRLGRSGSPCRCFHDVCSRLKSLCRRRPKWALFHAKMRIIRLRECSMSLAALVLTILSVIPRRVIPGVAARLRLGLRALRRRPFDHRRYSLMLRGYL